jgi:hypothetical protein
VRRKIAVQQPRDGEHERHRRRVEQAPLGPGRERDAGEAFRVQVEAIGAAERGALDERPVEDHGEGEREHGEEDLTVAREQQPEDGGERCRAGGADHDHQRGVAEPRAVREQRRGVGAEPEVEALAERHQPGAHEQHQPQHDQALGE